MVLRDMLLEGGVPEGRSSTPNAYLGYQFGGPQHAQHDVGTVMRTGGAYGIHGSKMGRRRGANVVVFKAQP